MVQEKNIWVGLDAGNLAGVVDISRLPRLGNTQRLAPRDLKLPNSQVCCCVCSRDVYSCHGAFGGCILHGRETSLAVGEEIMSHSSRYGDQQVLAVPAHLLFADGQWDGLQIHNIPQYCELIERHGVSLSRDAAENDPEYKHVVVVAILQVGDRVLVNQVSTTTLDDRMHNDWRFFAGGHTDPRDRRMGGDTLRATLQRELFGEEVRYRGTVLEEQLLGLLYLDTPQGSKNRVHLGAIYYLRGDSEDIETASGELESLRFVTLAEIAAHLDRYDDWCRELFPTLQSLQAVTV